MAMKAFLLVVTAVVFHHAGTSSACAQKVLVGFKAGVELTDTFNVTSQTRTGRPHELFEADIKRLIYGPTLEVTLPWSLGIEANALHKKLKYTSTTSEPIDFFIQETTATSWEVPILLKRYSRRFGLFRPYGGGGLSLRHVSAHTHEDEFGPSFAPVFTCCQLVFSGTIPTRDLIHSWSSGLVFGGGVDIQRSSFHVSPELQYTRWSNESFRSLGLSGAPGSASIHSTRNTLEFLIRFTYGL